MPMSDGETTDVRRKWRGVDPDERAAARRARLIRVAIELLASEGLAATTVRAVCARAKLHSRYFYESFEGIDELLVAVFDELAGRLLAEVTEASEAAGSGPRDRMHAGLAHIATIVEQQTSLFRILAVEAIGNEQLNRRRVRLLHDIASMMEQDAYRLYGKPPAGERIGALSARFVAAGLAETLVAWVEGDLGGDMEDMAADVAELMLAVFDRTRELAELGRSRKLGKSRSTRGPLVP